MQILSLTLLLAQAGMVAHASSHLNSKPHAAPTQAQLCGECLSFAPMQNMVGGAPTVVLAVQAICDPVLDVAPVVNVPHHAFSAFRSRAPPISL